MKVNCPNPYCVLPSSLAPNSNPIVRNGCSFRRSDSRYIQRYACKLCGKYFSKATFDPRYRQKKRRINPLLFQLFSSGVSQRRAAKILGINPKTAVRCFRYLADQARSEHRKTLTPFLQEPLKEVQFDDLETSEHTKCKPLSVALAVDPKTRKILSFQVSQMPAKGLLAKTAYRKYGYRADERRFGWERLFRELKPYMQQTAEFTSDENPHYPSVLRRHFPKVTHIRTPGGRGANTGQGELKKLRFDPIFSLNHTCAMLRANMNRLFRKTWCTTKTRKGLIDHLSIYTRYHNLRLTRFSDAKGGS
jgi:transposase-like protein